MVIIPMKLKQTNINQMRSHQALSTLRMSDLYTITKSRIAEAYELKRIDFLKLWSFSERISFWYLA